MLTLCRLRERGPYIGISGNFQMQEFIVFLHMYGHREGEVMMFKLLVQTGRLMCCVWKTPVGQT